MTREQYSQAFAALGFKYDSEYNDKYYYLNDRCEAMVYHQLGKAITVTYDGMTAWIDKDIVWHVITKHKFVTKAMMDSYRAVLQNAINKVLTSK